MEAERGGEKGGARRVCLSFVLLFCGEDCVTEGWMVCEIQSVGVEKKYDNKKQERDMCEETKK